MGAGPHRKTALMAEKRVYKSRRLICKYLQNIDTDITTESDEHGWRLREVSPHLKNCYNGQKKECKILASVWKK